MDLGRKIEDLLVLQTRTREALDKIETRLRSLEDRMTGLEASQPQLITEARAAASAASTAVTGAVLSDAITRLTRLEMRAEQLANRATPMLPPGQDEPTQD